MTQERYRIFDNMIEGVQVIDRDWRYVYVNDAVSRHSKLSKGDLLGHSMMEKYPGIEKTDLFKVLTRCMEEGVAKEWINEFDFPDGSRGYFELRMEPVEQGLLILSFDVTTQKRAEQIVRNTNRQLEELVRTRTSELVEQKAIIERQLQYMKEVNDTKDKFFSIVAHDLRSPLRSLKGISNLLIDGIVSMNNDEVQRLSTGLQSSVDNAINLADNLIEWARAQMANQGQVMSEIDLSEILDSVWKLYKDLADRKGIEIVNDSGLALGVMGDKNQLSFVIRNLVNNAIKYTQQNGRVIMSARKDNDRFVEVSVKDTGIGISEDHLSRLFRFDERHSHDGTQGEKGTGLGLKLSYDFVRLNEGRIVVNSQLGQGTEVRVLLKSA